MIRAGGLAAPDLPVPDGQQVKASLAIFHGKFPVLCKWILQRTVFLFLESFKKEIIAAFRRHGCKEDTL